MRRRPFDKPCSSPFVIDELVDLTRTTYDAMRRVAHSRDSNDLMVVEAQIATLDMYSVYPTRTLLSSLATLREMLADFAGRYPAVQQFESENHERFDVIDGALRLLSVEVIV